jgi:hypothetical protein
MTRLRHRPASRAAAAKRVLEQMLIFGEAHLRQIRSAYEAYYSQARAPGIIQRRAVASNRQTI